MVTHPPALAHGPIVEAFENVFHVSGLFRMGPGMTITRNMTIVREGESLCIVNSVRLTDAGEKELEKLGQVRHLVRIGAAHGADDPYFVARYRPKLWGPKGIRHKQGLSSDEELTATNSPVARVKPFIFTHGRTAEAALVIEQDGGIMVACDSYQNWTTYDGCSLLAKASLVAMRFGPAMIGGPWARMMGPEIVQDFDRILELPFRHLLSGHGTPLMNDARERLSEAKRRRFGPS